MSVEKFQVGIFYFLTISTEEDYEPSEQMLKYLKKSFSQFHCVIEDVNGSGKKHLHAVGLTTRRSDNVKKGIVKILDKDGITVSDFTVDYIPEPNVQWRLGYLMKEPAAVRKNWEGFTDAYYAEAERQYNLHPKRERAEKKSKKLSINQLADECIENNCETDEAIKDFIVQAMSVGKLDCNSYCKMNLRKFREYVQRRPNFD